MFSLEEIAAKAEKAPDGPWYTEPEKAWPNVEDNEGRLIVADWGEWLGELRAAYASDFIASAREAVPAMVETFKKLLVLHEPKVIEEYFYPGGYTSTGGTQIICRHCKVKYPCQTVKIINNSFGEGEKSE